MRVESYTRIGVSDVWKAALKAFMEFSPVAEPESARLRTSPGLSTYLSASISRLPCLWLICICQAELES